MMELTGKTAIVTGSTKGIGNGIAHTLAKQGANIVVVSRHQKECDAVAAELKEYGVKTLACSADLTQQTQINNLIQKTMNTFGMIDILINNAGSAITKKAEDLTEGDWDRVLDLDLKAVFFCAQAAGKIMIEQKYGKIINVASMFGLVADKQILPYCVAKGGVVQMTRALALEWARHNIQVNALCPGYVITPMNEEDLKDERIANHILKKVPARRYANIEDIVGASVYLASNASDYMTGQTLTVDGGWTCE